MTKEEKEKIIELRNKGLSFLQIAKETGKGKSTVGRYLKEVGLNKNSNIEEPLREEDFPIIMGLLQEGLNYKEIGEKIGHSRKNISAFMLRRDVRPIPKIEKILTPEEIEKLKSLYQQGQSVAKITTELSTKGLTENTIIDFLEENGVAIHKRGKQTNIKHEDFFERIDSEEKAYILGLLITDGYVVYPQRNTTHNPHWGITLETKDKYILERIKELVGSNVKIVDRTRNRSDLPNRKTPITFESQLIITSSKMVEDLKKYGIVPRKTFTVGLTELDESLMPHLIRGIFDGDGCISGNSISFVGNIHVISKLQNYLKSTLGIRRNKIHERINKEKGYVSSYTFSFSSQIDVSKFYHYIYDNATIYLSRKKDKFVFN